MTPVIPIHPRPGPDPATVHWHLPDGTLPVRGRATALPASLTALVTAGVVLDVDVADDHVAVTLAPGHAWADAGPRVRTALLAALERPEEWGTHRPSATTGGGPEGEDAAGRDAASDDVALHAAALEALAGEVGELARSHGGSIALESVRDGVVTVRMRGACAGCPAAGLTLHARLERELRHRVPGLVEIRSVDGGSGRTFLGLIGRRSR